MLARDMLGMSLAYLQHFSAVPAGTRCGIQTNNRFPMIVGAHGPAVIDAQVLVADAQDRIVPFAVWEH